MAAHGVRQLIADLARSHSRTIVISTHDLIEAAQVCDRVAVLRRGALVALGTPTELAGRVAARGLRLDIAIEHRPVVARVAAEHGYAMEPLDDAAVRLHGVEYLQVPELVRALVAAEIDVYGVTVDQSTLTDFYLAMHGDEEPS
jgi:ABC-2 type transport system ATP-binding protein